MSPSKRIATDEKNIFLIGKVYYYRGKGIEESLETSDFDEAVEKKKALESLLDRYSVGAFKQRFKTLFPLYKKDCAKKLKKGELRAITLTMVDYIIDNHLEPFFGSLKLSEFNHKVWGRYTQKGKVSDYANHRSVMNGFLKWARREGHLEHLFLLEIPKHKRRRRRPLTDEQVSVILKNANGGLLVFSAIALYCGLRRSEIMTLRWEYVDFSHRSLTLPEAVVKTKAGRQVPFNEVVGLLLQSRMTGQRDAGLKTPWVFHNHNDERRHADKGGLKTAWITLKKNHPILSGLTWHDFRATFETHMHKAQGFTDTQLEKMVGASVDVQKRLYVSMNADDLRGLENSLQVDGLDDALKTRITEKTATRPWGNRGKAKAKKKLKTQGSHS